MGVLLVHQLACDLEFVLKLTDLFGLLIYDNFHLFAQMCLQFKLFVSKMLLDLLGLGGMLCDAVLHCLLRLSHRALHLINFFFSRLYLVLQACNLGLQLRNPSLQLRNILFESILNFSLLAKLESVLLFHPLHIFSVNFFHICQPLVKFYLHLAHS
jgi:hypothetical protein